MSQAKTEEKKKDKKLILIILLLLFIIIGLIFFIFFMKKDDNKDDAVDRNVIVNEDDAEKMAQKLINEDRVPLGRFETMMSTTWTFEDGKSISDDAYVANVERNTNNVYFDLVRSDTEEVILASPIIPLGMKMDKITLDSPLPKGTYDCVCTYHLIDEEQKPISKVSVGVTVKVKN